MKYKSGYKYQLKENYFIFAGIYPTQRITTEYIEMTVSGSLCIKAGYAWDGPSGPSIDTKTFMRGSLVHDALYQLIREGHLPMTMREHADSLLHDICLQDGMSSFRAWYVHAAVTLFGKPSAEPSNNHKIEVAPTT